jgi:SAM-dependent methyltransferase
MRGIMPEKVTNETFNPKEYWEKRLSGSYNFRGVGYAALGLPYNRWLYRVRRHLFLKTARRLSASCRPASVLDVGTGTGFYIDQWKAAGFTNITGSDLTETAVVNLRKNYPAITFSLLDIGKEQNVFAPDSFDFISAFDVFFHIVDEEHFNKAIRNVHSLLKPNAYFIWSDNFLQGGRELSAEHQVSRSLAKTVKILNDAGLEIVSRKPMFWLMNAPVDSKNPYLKKWWMVLEGLLRAHPGIGGIVGALLFPLELFMVTVAKESPTTEIMVCRKTVRSSMRASGSC